MSDKKTIAALIEALEWAIADIEKRAKYPEPGQRAACLKRAHQTLISAKVDRLAGKMRGEPA